MADPELRLAILSEMASIRHELTRLRDGTPPLGPSEFMHKYIAHLNDRLGQLEQALKDYEEAAD
jgi:hypothetical protein